ncbi:MAG: hypothetical protein U1E45_15055 [Geminicoccaceae bacterium]
MTVGELSRRMTSAEVTEWMAYFRIIREPQDDVPDEAPASDWGASLKGRMLAWDEARKSGR